MRSTRPSHGVGWLADGYGNPDAEVPGRPPHADPERDDENVIRDTERDPDRPRGRPDRGQLADGLVGEAVDGPAQPGRDVGHDVDERRDDTAREEDALHGSRFQTAGGRGTRGDAVMV